MNTYAEAAGDTPRAATVPARISSGGTLITLLRREFWEHRYLWLVPLILAGLLALCAIFGHGRWSFDRQDPDIGFWTSPDQRIALGTIVQWVLAVPLYLVTLFMVSYYALDCLYAERKDRSILFWKSLPVSDRLTVGAKLLVALVAAPLLAFALALAAHLVFSAIVGARIAAGSLPPAIVWSTREWLRTELVMLLVLGLAVLWYAPLVAALMLVSAWARRSPFLWATLPLLLAPLLERIAFGTTYVWRFMHYRSFGIWRTLIDGYQWRIVTKHHMEPVGTLLNDLDFRAAYTDIDLWMGVLVAAAILYAAVRIRRYRDDT